MSALRWMLCLCCASCCIYDVLSVPTTDLPVTFGRTTRTTARLTTSASTTPQSYEILTAATNTSSENVVTLPCWNGLAKRMGVVYYTRNDLKRPNLTIEMPNCGVSEGLTDVLYVSVWSYNLNDREALNLLSPARALNNATLFENELFQMNATLKKNERVHALLLPTRGAGNLGSFATVSPHLKMSMKNMDFSASLLYHTVVTVEYVIVQKPTARTSAINYALTTYFANGITAAYCNTLQSFIPSPLCPNPLNPTLSFAACPSEAYGTGYPSAERCMNLHDAHQLFSSYGQATLATTPRPMIRPTTPYWWFDYTTPYVWRPIPTIWYPDFTLPNIDINWNNYWNSQNSNTGSYSSTYYKDSNYYRNLGLGLGLTLFFIGILLGALKACSKASANRRRLAARTAAVNTLFVNDGGTTSENRVIGRVGVSENVPMSQPFFGAPPSYEDVTKTPDTGNQVL